MYVAASADRVSTWPEKGVTPSRYRSTADAWWQTATSGQVTISESVRQEVIIRGRSSRTALAASEITEQVSQELFR